LSGPGPQHPSQGARLLLERRQVAADGSSATYRAAIITADQRFEYEAVLRLDGSADLTPIATPAPDQWQARLLAHARQAARAAERRRGDQLPPWPHRVLRWRDA
jgi:hypothetical protein